MARARHRKRTEISLFPFLSVLACTIGTLTLIITATATSQVAAGGIDIERYEQLEREIAEGRLELAAIEDLQQDLSELDSSLAGARERTAALTSQRAALGDPLAADAPQVQALRDSASRIEGLEAELATLQKQAAKQRGELDERRRKLANAPIRIRPSGSGWGLVPQFIECDETGIRCHHLGYGAAGPDAGTVADAGDVGRAPEAGAAYLLQVEDWSQQPGAGAGGQ